ncbi:MAG: hypothetical protein ACLUGJ_09950 [Blautia wexlerae]
MQALAPYYHKAGYENVTAAIDRGLARLSEMQNDSGGYSTMGVETEESCAQVITALCSLGIDPETDSRFIKGGHWTIENLVLIILRKWIHACKEQAPEIMAVVLQAGTNPKVFGF